MLRRNAAGGPRIPLLPMKSHVTTGSRKRAVQGAPRPRTGEADFIQATVFQHSRPASASSTSPRWRATGRQPTPQRGPGKSGTRAADRAVAAARSALSLSDVPKEQDSEGGPRWRGSSEAPKPSRSMARVGCRSRPGCAACSMPATRHSRGRTPGARSWWRSKAPTGATG